MYMFKKISMIVFRSLRSSQESATIKPRQIMCNAIKSKKANTLLQAKKSLFRVKKTFTIRSIKYLGKRKSEHWLGPYLSRSNVDKKKNKFETGSLTLQEEMEELHTNLIVS